jgi:hypothetical protein
VYEIDLTTIKELKKPSKIYPFVLVVPLIVHTLFPGKVAALLSNFMKMKFALVIYFVFVPLLHFVFRSLSDLHLNIVRFVATVAYVCAYNYDYFFGKSTSVPRNTWNLNISVVFINIMCVTYFGYLSGLDCFIYLASFSLWTH